MLRFAGRWIPWFGWGLLALDVAMITNALTIVITARITHQSLKGNMMMDNKREKMLQILYDFYGLPPEKCYPEVTPNHTCAIYVDDVTFLILEYKKFLGAPQWSSDTRFPDGIYFDPEHDPIWKHFFCVLLLPLIVVLLLFDLLTKYIYKILKIEIIEEPSSNDDGKPPLTAIQFVNMIIALWEDYQTEQKNHG
ncbi:hypothetical protein [Commensalibacter communis]|uniref:hypothetical protein n=1 Tax=Commensalibacter communis TaxID=2972786 RepID=UPI0022FF8147|nr:hypothetical protein [Commensalibacter communis]CAI3953164.1 unnamed protein product [Commensalibacter communis]CAI3953263.1 unnamed protein product [Commensalibacter communis]